MRMETIYKLPDGFRTSINVLNRVLNISCSTIEHELKKHNYKYHNRSSNCIDEKMLDIFAEKFCKNLKRYFERSLQEYDTLSFEESKRFHEFAQTYSKYGRFTRKWRDIDKAAIKNDFLRQIVELTAREKEEQNAALLKLAESVICSSCEESLRVFDVTDSSLLNAFSNFNGYDLGNYLDSANEIESHIDSVSEFISTKQDDFHNRVILVEKIKHSRLYHSRPSRKAPTYRFVPLFERIYVSARFHIVSDDGTEDELFFTNSLRA